MLVNVVYRVSMKMCKAYACK